MIAAHCDMCAHCSGIVALLSSEISSQCLDMPISSSSNPQLNGQYAYIYDSIVNAKASTNSDSAKGLNKAQLELELNGRHFTLPSTLARISDKIGSWTQILGKLWFAPVNIGGVGQCQLIYMDAGSSVPEHSHKGNEITLVINGMFEDGMSQYQNGDFIALNDQHTHTPRAISSQGCLVMSLLDEPLHFTSGVARLINPLSHLYFKMSTRR